MEHLSSLARRRARVRATLLASRATWLRLALVGLVSAVPLWLVNGLASSPAHAAGVVRGQLLVNRPLDPQTVQSCAQAGAGQSATCERQALAQIDQARALEGIGPMHLPGNYLSLTPVEQLLAVIVAERSDRGLTVPTGLVATYDHVAQVAAKHAQDAGGPRGYAIYGSIEAQGLSSVLIADYAWMYDDGFGGLNLDCESPAASGCWGHRAEILRSYSATPYFYMGAAAVGGGFPVYTTVLVDAFQPQVVAYSDRDLPTPSQPRRAQGRAGCQCDRRCLRVPAGG